MKIIAKVARGENAGTPLYPHLYEDGMYVVSKTSSVRDYIHLTGLHEIAAHIADGFKVRMSNPKEGVAGPRLIRACSISVTA